MRGVAVWLVAMSACVPQEEPPPEEPDLARAAEDGGAPEVDMLPRVSHGRELRAMWVATVSRLDFPSRTNLTAQEAKAELASIVEVTAAAGLNAIFFQVRPESDAFYQSTLEPWSRYASGTQGKSPGWDALALLIELGHPRGVEVHAWMNPYRALVSAGTATSPLHVTQRFPHAAITYDNIVVMDPANAQVRAHVVAVAVDVTQRYDVDGVVFDDYFYPYPGATPFPDGDSYDAYQSGGGTLGKSDWRRENVNALVEAVGAAVHAEKPWVRFGVAPFGIYRPGMPPGVVGLDAYEAISCDSLRFISQGWVDYLAPQLYWPSTASGQPFGALIGWWAEQSSAGRPVLATIGLYRLGSSSAWTLGELETQVSLTRARAPAAAGQTWFRYQTLRDDVMGVKQTFGKLYAAPARPPVVPGLAAQTLDPPSVTPATGGATVSHPAASSLRGYAVYRAEAGAWTFTRFVVTPASSVALTPGRWAISAIDRGGVESLGAPITIE